MRRIVEPELLDDLPPADPHAVGSRADLRRLNVIMGHTGILTRALQHHLPDSFFHSRRLRLVELGAGDGTFLLRLARRWASLGVTARVTLLDRQDIVSAETRRAFETLHWSVECVATDVSVWLKQSSMEIDLVLANLFLHHFPERALSALLNLVAARTRLFITCEPSRSPLALTASHLLGLLGCNRVTRHDAIVSVRAGFVDQELSALWPADTRWNLSEQSVGCFSHCLVAQRNA